MELDDTEEVQIMTGVYLTDYRTSSQPPQNPQFSQSSHPTSLNVPPRNCDTDPSVAMEITELENSIKHLIRSNVELAKAMAEDPDPVYAESIQENLNIIAKRKLKMNELLAKQQGRAR